MYYNDTLILNSRQLLRPITVQLINKLKIKKGSDFRTLPFLFKQISYSKAAIGDQPK